MLKLQRIRSWKLKDRLCPLWQQNLLCEEERGYWRKSEEEEIIYPAAATPWISGKSWNVKNIYPKVSSHHCHTVFIVLFAALASPKPLVFKNSVFLKVQKVFDWIVFFPSSLFSSYSRNTQRMKTFWKEETAPGGRGEANWEKKEKPKATHLQRGKYLICDEEKQDTCQDSKTFLMNRILYELFPY